MHDRLVQAIEEISESIEAGNFRSEAEISQGVVKRVLHELSWPVFDVRVVAPEFKIGARKVDYALCQPPGQPSVLVEVKDLGKADGKGEKQLFEYCFHQGVPIAVLTDGRRWSFFFLYGQGGYAERRFAQINLVEDDPAHAARTLARYLDMADVGSGAARRRAQRDYEEVRTQREADSKYQSVWRNLLGEPDPSLLDLFSKGVETAAGVRPDRERAAAFIRGQAGVVGGWRPPKATQVTPIDPSPGKPKPQSSPKPVQSTLVPDPVPTGPQPTRDRPSFTFQGQTRSFQNGAKLLGAVFREFASQDPDFCRRYSQRFSGRKRPYVAKSKTLLYPNTPHLASQAVSLGDGWWLGTHMGNRVKLTRIKQACEVAGVELGTDIIVHMPIGSRAKPEPE